MTLLEKDAHSGEARKKCWCGHHDKFHKDDVCVICQNRAYKGDQLANWSYRHPANADFPVVPPFNTIDYVKEIQDVQRALIRYTEKHGSPT